jgi:hypothetical protein
MFKIFFCKLLLTICGPNFWPFGANAIFLREPEIPRVCPWGLAALVPPGFKAMPRLCLGNWLAALVALGSALGDSLSLWPQPMILNLNKNTNMINKYVI